ncbi:MAG TPA: 2-isopropylmalate synthase [Blastocatellia bacterium]
MGRSKISIFDTTLRDGEQSPGCSMTPSEKLRLASQLESLGVDIIEAGFPISSEADFESVKTIAEQVRRPVIAALARAVPDDVDRAWRALESAARPRIHTFLATSDIHLNYKLKISRQQAIDQACNAVSRAKGFCDDVEFSPEDATRTDLDFLCRISRAAVGAGATTINIPDTVGYTTPGEFSAIVTAVKAALVDSGATISVHCHNDLGLAVANSIAAIEAGARQVECAINGIGERAGNASLEEIVMAIWVRGDALPFETAVNTRELYSASQMLSEITGVDVQPNKAIVGRNAFAHEAGIHQDGMIKNRTTYEIMTPESVGVPETRLVLGKHSGRHALGVHCERLGYQLPRRDLDVVYRRFLAVVDKEKAIDDAGLVALIREAQGSQLPDADLAIFQAGA